MTQRVSHVKPRRVHMGENNREGMFDSRRKNADIEIKKSNNETL